MSTSLPRWTLSLDGAAPVTAESLGVQLRQRMRYSLRTDVLSVGMPRGLGRPMALQPDMKVDVFLDDQPFFSGRVDEQPKHSQTASDGSVTLQILGPWQWLESWPALRDFNGVYAGTYGLPAVEDDGVLSGSWSLFAGDGFPGSLMSTGEQSAWALMPLEFRQRANTSTVAGTVSIGTEFTVADIPAGQTPPNSQGVQNTMVAEILRMCNRWNPTVSWWTDYSTTPPTFRAMPAEPMILDGGISNYWVGIDRTMINSAPVPPRWDFDYYIHSEYETPVDIVIGQGGVSCQGGVRWDMVPSVVTVRGNDGWTQYPAGVPVNGKRAVWLQRAGSTPGTTLVEYLYKSLATPRFEGRLVISDGTGRPYETARPGRVWTIWGDDVMTARGTALATTTSVTDDLMTGTTTCELGLPKHLGAGEMLSLSLWGKLMGN